MAAARAPQRTEDQVERRAARLSQRLSDVGAAQAQRHVTAAEQSGSTAYVDPAATPTEWAQAVELARLVTIRRAKRRDTITYGEIRWAIFDELRMLVDESVFTDLLLAISGAASDALLASIAVHPDSGKPGDDFLLAAMELGFDTPVETLQRQAYQHFA
jgi:hypothetical protein